MDNKSVITSGKDIVELLNSLKSHKKLGGFKIIFMSEDSIKIIVENKNMYYPIDLLDLIEKHNLEDYNIYSFCLDEKKRSACNKFLKALEHSSAVLASLVEEIDYSAILDAEYDDNNTIVIDKHITVSTLARDYRFHFNVRTGQLRKLTDVEECLLKCQISEGEQENESVRKSRRK